MADHTTTVNAPQGAETRPNLLRMLAPTLRDIAVPLAAYYGLHWAGYSDFAALLAGGLVSGVMVLVEVVRARRIDAMSALILAGFAFGIVSSLISGDARMMIVRDSLTTAVIGLAFAVSALFGKPLTYVAARKAFSGNPRKLAEMEYKFNNIPMVRRTHNRIAAMWGVGMIGESVVRVVLAYQLPIHTMAWLSSVLMIGTTATLMLITVRTIKWARRSEAAATQPGYASVHE
ncbi:VC0807 family protein [Nocardia sp. CDC160]|uniref:VC0807 family protein n=1 Tax=Nocardia sp. CDC160 TaxID=3112166 RepID=UPI002DB5B845|nr:VC0807 family protein [Nocardia sp. CDC160]MEC3916317.1 VC0807 family protein [Nocardia sp. CDC160]